jgi:sialate O-acetylesterase
MNRRLVGLAVLSFIAAALCVAAHADVRLPAIIGSNMVVQQQTTVPIWGWADPDERVTVSLGNERQTATTDAEGNWMVRLKSPGAGGPHRMTVSGKNTLTLDNILVGEVWVGSGQSNMQMGVGSCNNAAAEIAAATLPKIRLFSVKLVPADTPQRDTEGAWVECSPQTVPGFSAALFFFGRDLHQKLNVPVGLINSSWGGTPCEAWASRPSLDACASCKPILDRWDEWLADLPKIQADYDAAMAKWQKDADEAKAAGKPEPQKPGAHPVFNRSWQPAALYNGMIAPIIPFAIKGAIWYQGESNAGRAYQYRTLFPAMIEDWRKNWGEGDFPFLWVQLANFMARKPDPADSAWAELREAQTMTLSLPKTAQAVIIDIGDAADIHPKNKQDVGKRLALGAERIAYDRNVIYSGPLYSRMEVEGTKIKLHFRFVDGGLVAQGGGALTGFAIAGEDRKFVWANATIERGTVVVSSDQVPRPVAVRYAWADNPECNLYNQAGLPACPFRTDDWPGVTANAN